MYDIVHKRKYYQDEKFIGKVILKNKNFNYIFMVGHFNDSI